jgi:hypothetical protein
MQQSHSSIKAALIVSPLFSLGLYGAVKMKKKELKIKMKLLFSLFLLLPTLSYAQTSSIYLNQYHNDIQVKSWKSIRDQGIIKQDLDYSCGAASIATLLNGYFQQNITEEQVLKIMDKGDLMASFDDMQRALGVLGFESKGYAVSFNTLKTLKLPVIVYIKHRKTDHFSVISGINDEFIQLADPSLGKVTLTKYQFLDMWNTRNDEIYTGKILAILPKPNQKTDATFFSKEVKQPSLPSLRFLATQ